MKKNARYFCTMAILMMAGFAFVSCIDNVVEENNDGKYSMTVTATKGATKALQDAGSTLTASWSENDEVQVYQGDTPIGTLYAQSSGTTTQLKGDLSSQPTPGATLTLKYHSPSYASQDGTLTGSATSIDKVCDYATASIVVSEVNGYHVKTNTTASFVNQQAIVKFTLTENKTGYPALNASKLTVTDGTNVYTVIHFALYHANQSKK